MNIFETLRMDHASLRGILEDLIEKSEDSETRSLSNVTADQDWPELFYELKIGLVAHHRAEEAVLYNKLRSLPYRGELADVKTEEHHLIEELLEDLEEINPADQEWSVRLALLQNQIESHFAEEETTVFSLLQPIVSDVESEKMCSEFESLRNDIEQGAMYHPKGRSFINPAGLDL
jgi:hemerythrin superfamily protein